MWSQLHVKQQSLLLGIPRYEFKMSVRLWHHKRRIEAGIQAPGNKYSR